VPDDQNLPQLSTFPRAISFTTSRGFAQEVLSGEGFSRKGAKTQSAAAFLRGFLCAFAPLREKNPFSHRALARFEYFLCKPKTQSAAAFLKDFLCAFAPLRDKSNKESLRAKLT